MNNTVTPKQVAAMEKEIDGIITKAKNDIENCTIDFCNNVSRCWADENAVDLVKKVTNSMNGVIIGMCDNSNKIKGSIVDIHNIYAKQAKKSSMNASKLKFHSALNPNVVKSTFDGDAYGFKDDVSAYMVADAVNNLANRCEKISDELSSSLTSINAFGNQEISRMIIKSGSEIGGIVGNAVGDIMNNFKASFAKASEDYANIGNNFDISMLGGPVVNSFDDML